MYLPSSHKSGVDERLLQNRLLWEYYQLMHNEIQPSIHVGQHIIIVSVSFDKSTAIVSVEAYEKRHTSVLLRAVYLNIHHL